VGGDLEDGILTAGPGLWGSPPEDEVFTTYNRTLFQCVFIARRSYASAALGVLVPAVHHMRAL